jgi:hypothetical protein
LKRLSTKSLAVIAVLILASVPVICFFEASIYYSLQVYAYQKTENQWYTIDIEHNSYPGTFMRVRCENKGLLTGTFDILVTVANATFPENSNQSAQLVNRTTIRLPYALHGLEETCTDLYFTIDDNATGFFISIALQTSQLLIRHTEANWAGQSVYPYFYVENKTWYPAQIE